MNERILSAINKLNDKVDTLDKQFTAYKDEDIKNNVALMSSKLDRYSIKDGEWMYGGYPTGETAVGPQGPKGEKGDKGDKGDSFTFDDLTPEQVALITGADGIDGKDGKEGAPGKDGKDGIDGRPGKDGKDGKDGITPELEIGNIKSVSTYDPAKVSLRKKKDKYIIDMDIPRGRPGANGADGGNGISAKINGQSTINIEAGTNIRIDQQGETLTINSTGGGGGGTSDYTQLTNKPSINNVTLSGNKTLSDLGIQPAGNYALESDMTEAQNDIEALQTENERLKATLPTTTGEGQDITLDKTAEMEFVKPPLPMGNSEQNGNPSPDNAVPITNVTGNVEVTISNENNTESKTLPVSLGNIELCKIGNYQDYLYKNNGKWYKYNAIKKLVLNGSENWSAHGSIASWFFWDGITNGFTNNTISGYALSNYFTQKAYSTVTSLNNGEFAYGQVAGETRKRFVIKDTDYTTVANFKSWLSTHNTIVYYVLATPTSTEITDATLISQLEEISKTLSYQGQTNIESNTITMFNVEAYQSTKLILENLDSRLTLVEG